MGDKPKKSIDSDLIRELAALLTEADLTEIEIESDDYRIRVARGAVPVEVTAPVSAASASALASDSAAAVESARNDSAVPSPMVGTIYLASEPGARPFVDVGEKVEKGQTLLIVEAMKHMNEVASPRAGTVTEILVEDGQPIEFGEPLLVIE